MLVLALVVKRLSGAFTIVKVSYKKHRHVVLMLAMVADRLLIAPGKVARQPTCKLVMLISAASSRSCCLAAVAFACSAALRRAAISPCTGSQAADLR